MSLETLHDCFSDETVRLINAAAELDAKFAVPFLRARHAKSQVGGTCANDSRPRGRPLKYPLRFIALGDCMFFPGLTSKAICKRAPDYKPMKFRTKKWRVKGVAGVMVWRIA